MADSCLMQRSDGQISNKTSAMHFPVLARGTAASVGSDLKWNMLPNDARGMVGSSCA